MFKIKLLQPDLVLGDTVLDLTQEILDQYEIKGLILDVDETLVPLTKSFVSEELRHWIDNIKAKTPIWLVSNNLSRNRISYIASTLKLPYLSGAGKPSRRKLRKAVSTMDLPVSQIAMVGDRLFTDVLAGNRLGMFTILVNPIQISKSHPIQDLEIWISKRLGVSLTSSKYKLVKKNKNITD
ncbi:YqeG family HAD IIIA-type phosphatase [Candidatus Atelocyanobacterium thalassae]|uniref:HAD phosphatase subfamily IIIA n=1 Tax=Atelocyanobacterium thalassa (isolate ALOHA) TaxID=1453429 RepID=D3ENN6_ATETH|nr:YqeG family HAD IIIA-type phosphatase [Candidatus Atelocyanobacterium thalassa]ADB95086.1 HAD phosphatase subfamily IIIA [Candidatus Atelocyanobacterium thalassa isolate ALOHA]MCH2543420.1 YqeG family HAD IIIA-type phosphatase [Candidatus Atelocyanobacterium sp. ALOHA_A2.5_9]|tara:strand:+ start:289 stop:834 length:546 start_codon:yes stop_codon:yes gene_type:complete